MTRADAMTPTDVMMLLARSTDLNLGDTLAVATIDPDHPLRTTISVLVMDACLQIRSSRDPHLVGVMARGALWEWAVARAPGFAEIENGLRGGVA